LTHVYRDFFAALEDDGARLACCPRNPAPAISVSIGAVEEARLFLHTMLLAIGALLPIVGPLTNAPLYIAVTGHLPAEERKALAATVARYSFLLLLGSLFVGAYVLDLFALSVPIVQVAGGLVVCSMAWSLLHEPEGADAEAAAAVSAQANRTLQRAFYPLTMPLTVGPGSISVAITLGANPDADVRNHVVTALGQAAGALAVAVSVYYCYRYAEEIVQKLGETGRTVLMRLMAFLLLCIGVQIIWNGVRALLHLA
jgi:multiple antibiotic resistance protein